MRIRNLCESELSEIDKAVIVAFAYGSEDGISAAEISLKLESAGHAKINRSRLQKKLKADKRVVSRGEGFSVSARLYSDVEKLAKAFSGPTRPKVSDASLDEEIFDNSRNYVKNVVEQINVSYQNACFDCAAVMVRRLFETLIIDSFEQQGALAEITKPDGNVHQLSALIGKLKTTTSFSVSRQTKEAAEHLKNVGDWSAHNRRHRARKSDLDSAIRHMRLAASDLLHLAGQD